MRNLPIQRVLLIAGSVGIIYLAAALYGETRGSPWEGASLASLLGRDEFGRDVMSVAILSTFNSLLYGVACAVIALLTATVPAFVIAFDRSRLFSSFVEAVARVIEGVPIVVWVLVFAIVVPAAPRALSTAAFMLAVLPYLLRLLSGEFSRLASYPYVEAARSQQLRAPKMVAYHLLPNSARVIMPAMAQVTGLAVAIDGAIAIVGSANRTELNIGVLLLRGKENLLGHPEMMFVAVSSTLATFAVIWVVTAKLFPASALDGRLL